MSIDKLQNETCDDIHHLSDHELEVVTGGHNPTVLCECNGFFLELTRAECQKCDRTFG